MASREIPREEWRSWFDDFSRDLGDFLVTIEILGGELGAETEGGRARLTALTYDDKDDILVIGLDAAQDDVPEDVQHIVYGPRRIRVAEGEAEIAFEVQDEEGTSTVVRLDRADALT